MSHAAAHGAPHSPDTVLRHIAERLPVRPNARKRMIWVACMAIGVMSLVYLFATQPQRAWGSYAINALYWLGIAQGGVILACAIRLANGRWGGPVVRLAESLSAYLPFAYGFMVILLVGGIWTYLPWTRHVEPRQAAYLNVPFLYARVLIGLGLLWWLSRRLVRLSLRTDAHLLRNHVAPELKPEYEKLSAGWRGDREEAEHQRHQLAHLAPQICLAYAVVFTVLAWDFILSLTPEWVSTLFGWWFFMGAFLTGIAMTSFLATQVRAKYRLEDFITPNHFWDVGKVLFAICIFWAYQFWSQYLPIWYANLPEETGWVFLRFEEPWRPWAFAVFTMVFVIPFLGLLNKQSKTRPFWLATFSLIVMTGMWLERHVLVMPSLEPNQVWIGLPEAGVTIGFLGVFGWAVQGFLTRYPSVQVADALVAAEGPAH
jgi:Ni/Fe-hydrogenase subunit HybB-like protein